MNEPETDFMYARHYAAYGCPGRKAPRAGRGDHHSLNCISSLRTVGCERRQEAQFQNSAGRDISRRRYCQAQAARYGQSAHQNLRLSFGHVGLPIAAVRISVKVGLVVFSNKVFVILH
jgi:hypothetical protein